jgi:hypothetical protein
MISPGKGDGSAVGSGVDVAVDVAVGLAVVDGGEVVLLGEGESGEVVGVGDAEEDGGGRLLLFMKNTIETANTRIRNNESSTILLCPLKICIYQKMGRLLYLSVFYRRK